MVFVVFRDKEEVDKWYDSSVEGISNGIESELDKVVGNIRKLQCSGRLIPYEGALMCLDKIRDREYERLGIPKEERAFGFYIDDLVGKYKFGVEMGVA